MDEQIFVSVPLYDSHSEKPTGRLRWVTNWGDRTQELEQEWQIITLGSGYAEQTFEWRKIPREPNP